MSQEFPRFDQAQVLVLGDVLLDRYWYGGTSRISPEAPVPVVNVDNDVDLPGGAGNVAMNLAALGTQVTISGLVGEDEAAQILQRKFEASHVQHALQPQSLCPTITKLRVISRNQQLMRLDFEAPFSVNDSEHLVAQGIELLGDHQAVVLSDYLKGTLSNPQPLIQAAKEKGIAVLIDPKGPSFERYRGATLLTPNMSEFEAVVGVCDCEEELIQKGHHLVSSLELDALLITRSEKGMTLLEAGEMVTHLPTQAREVYDVTGAGDTVIATLASALASGLPLKQAVEFSNLAAGIVVGKLGTATVSAEELRKVVQGRDRFAHSVVTEDQLGLVLEEARNNGEKVVFTNGCFDILHAGHVGYLEEARRLGDRLIVAINSDKSVSRLKGEGRPVNPAQRRMTVLAALASVDWVLQFEDDTPERLLESVRPDVLVKGGDYDVSQVVGGEFVASYGGDVQVLSCLDGCSTTAIVEKIQKHSS